VFKKEDMMLRAEAAHRMALAPGTKLGPYEIVASLGSGGMGEVYRARDPRLGRMVAMKVIPADVVADAGRLQRFQQEARAVGSLNHPHILAVYDVGAADGIPYLISELLEGETLREQLMRGPLPFRKSLEYGIQIAKGLAAAQAKGIIHRDLKPENLFITREGHVKILDFGLAKLSEQLDVDAAQMTTCPTEVGVVVGTVGYLSPEQVRGSSSRPSLRPIFLRCRSVRNDFRPAAFSW
jgi:serine/threonine protein kinase